MSLIKLMCPKEVPDNLLQRLSSTVAITLGEPEEEVMVLYHRVDLLMGGTEGNAAYAEVKCQGELDRVLNHELTMKICILLNDHLGIPCQRLYVTFQSFEPDHWGWKKSITE